MLSSILPLLAISAAVQCVGAVVTNFTNSTTYLSATALTTGSDNNTQFECWQFTSPFTSNNTRTDGLGTFSFGDLSNVTYTVVPAHFSSGTENALSAQFLLFLSGLAVVSVPNNDTELYVVGGSEGLIFTADTNGTGHNISFPTNDESIMIQIPLANGIPPPHEVMYSGPCNESSQVYTNTTA